MTGSTQFLVRRKDDPIHQIASMKTAFPDFTYRQIQGGGVRWVGLLKPTLESTEYRVRILHRPNRQPRVHGDGHALDHRCRHLYRDGSLCLYWPKEWWWTPGALLAETIVPWAALWLYYYEAWQECGEWLGPSSPHGVGKGENHR